MDGLTTVVLVHEAVAPDVRRLLALCDDHVAILKRAAWAGVDEIVGFSTVMECEACALIEASPANLALTKPTSTTRRSHLRAIPAKLHSVSEPSDQDPSTTIVPQPVAGGPSTHEARRAFNWVQPA